MPLHKDLTGTDLHAPGAHKTQHENGGSDEISVAGLSGTLADPQTPTTHATSHQNGGGDEISVAGLSGELADAQPVDVRKNSTGSVFKRSRLNFIEGSNVTLTIADDSSDDEVDITIASTGGGGSSGYVMREEHVASASASLDFTAWYSASYETYNIEIIDLITQNNTEVGIQVSTDGGSTWLASTNYESWQNYAYSGGAGTIGSAGTSRLSLRQGSNSTLIASTGYTASLKLSNPGGTSLHKSILGHSAIPDNSIGLINITISCRIKTTSAINAIRVIPDSGNITSGTVRVYGIAKA